MNKRSNPFFPQQAAYPPHPPLPPGPPPQQPPQYDYSAYWAATQAAQQPQPGHSHAIPQWTPPGQPPAGPSGVPVQIPQNQSSLYANYGYGGRQNLNWPRQPIQPQQQLQQQPLRPQFPIPQQAQPPQPFYPPQQHHAPVVPPGRPFPGVAPVFPQPPQQYRPQQPMFQQLPQPPPPQHSPPHLPPAKRPRFEGPANTAGSSSGSVPSGPSHGMGRGGAMSGNFSGPGRGGAPPTGPGSRGGAPRGRGSPMGIGGGPSIGMMRGGALNNTGMRSRGGHAVGGRGTHSGGQMGGHRGGRGNWHNQSNHNRRGASGPGRGRGANFGHNNHPRDAMLKFSASGNAAEKERSGIKEEIKQTLTDFRIVGLEIESLEWKWGSCGETESQTQSDDTVVATEPSKLDQEAVDNDSKLALADNVEEIEFGSAVKDVVADVPVPPESLSPKATLSPKSVTEDLPVSKKTVSLPKVPPPSSPPRIRIYFNTPVSLEENRPKPSINGAAGVSNRAKRKMTEDEDEEGRRRRTKLNPASEAEDAALDTQAKANDVVKDGDSTAPSVDVSATASVSGRTEDEGDWLMEAIGGEMDAIEESIQEATHESPLRGEMETAEEGIQEATHESPLRHGMDDADAEGEDDPDAEFTDMAHEKDDLGYPDDEATMPMIDNADGFVDDRQLLSVAESADMDVPNGDVFIVPSSEDLIPSQPIDDTVQEDVAQSKPTLTTDLHMDLGADPEPPASPASQDTSQQSLSHTLHSSGSSFSSTIVSSCSQTIVATCTSQKPDLTMPEKPSSERKVPSANRISISYASGARRLLVDAQIVESLKIWRAQGRIEVFLSLQREGEVNFKGLIAESYSQATHSYIHSQLKEEDELLPPWSKIVTPSKTTLTIYLDKEKPLTEPRWVKTGDVEEWLRNTFGILWVSGEDGWEKRIEVVDPDPPPTIHTVLENWTSSSMVGLEAERQRFVKTHMSESDNLLEILLRLVRGERATPLPFSNVSSSSNLHLTGPLLTALSPGSTHASQQTHLTLAIVAMVRMAESFAERVIPSSEDARQEVNERVGEIIRCLPQHLLHKSLDGIFREWKETKKRGGRV
ncbi:hypothetical protein BU17DRAFT_60665 [Hysterangium stoloniferum]|nr:hypothetical protein BU17DRAFT_60665 [Hysterangium stoloniferum]